jgi:single-stranded DNA-binding protein
MVNEVKLSGNATEDSTPINKRDSGEVLGHRFRIAYNTGDQRTPTGFISVTAWQPTMRPVAKGATVNVSGSLGFDQWETDGVKRSSVTLIAQEVS